MLGANGAWCRSAWSLRGSKGQFCAHSLLRRPRSGLADCRAPVQLVHGSALINVVDQMRREQLGAPKILVVDEPSLSARLVSVVWRQIF
jgi:hypothetical protein